MFLDILVFTLIFWSVFSGLKKGFILSISSFIGILVSLSISSDFVVDTYKYFNRYLDMPYTNVKDNYYIYVCCYIIVMIVIYFSAILIGKIVKAIFGHIMLSWLDYLAGGVLGFTRGLFLALCLILVFAFISKTNRNVKNILDNSVSVEVLPIVSKTFLNVLPKRIRLRLESYAKELIEEKKEIDIRM